MTVIADFEVAGEPIPKARARTTRGHTYTPERTRNAEEAVLLAFAKTLSTHRPHKDDRYRVRLTFFRGTKRACDVDNLAKTVLDALNGAAWVDDSQIVLLSLGKLPADDRGARTHIRVELMPRDEVAA